MADSNPHSKFASQSHSRCLLCGDQNPQSLNLRFEDVGDGIVSTQFKPRTELQGYDDILHGGVVCALLDAAMTHCLFHKGIQAVTGDLHVRFLHSAPCAATMEIRAWVLASYPPLYRLRAEIHIGELLIAWGEAKFVQRRSGEKRSCL